MNIFLLLKHGTVTGIASVALLFTFHSDAIAGETSIRYLQDQSSNFICTMATERGLELAEMRARDFLKEKQSSSGDSLEIGSDFLRPLTDEKDAMVCAGLNQYYADMINATRASHDGTEYNLFNVSYFYAGDTIIAAAEKVSSPALVHTGHYGVFTIFHDKDLKVIEWKPSKISDHYTRLLSDGLREKIRDGD